MSRIHIYFLVALMTSMACHSCVTKKKKNETSKVGKFYHNTTAYYNGYWNAKEILKESLVKMRYANVDDYTKILEVEDYISLDNPKLVKSEMDTIIEKVTTVAALHEPSDWVDDCYVMMGKAQYLKQEYETSEETLEYFQEDFNPSNPYGRNYKSKKLTGKAAKKAKEEARKEEAEIKEKEKEIKEKLKEEKAKTREDEKKARAKEREDAKKERDRVRKENAKNRKKGVRTKKTTIQAPAPVVITNADSTVLASSIPKSNIALDKKQEEPEVYTPPKPEKPKEDKTAYSEGLLWLAKTYIKRENWFAAQMLIDKLENSAVSEDIKSDLPATYAQLYIKQERYAEALTKLNEAMDIEGNRQQRARYAFIAGQISQLSDNNTAALAYFEKAKKDATDIKMEFMAQMAIAKSGIKSGSKVRQDIIADLQKMLKEDKNISFQDQIYFTLAEIELSLDNQKEAIEYFRKSVASNQSDQKLKSEAYYRIANMLYKKENYLEASLYYDSTFTLLQNNDPRYASVQKFVSNLKEIVTNLNNISYQDTLLYFASLTDEDRKKIIPEYLERNKKEDPAIVQNVNLVNKTFGGTDPLAFNNSNFFAYNKVTKTKGKEDFDKLWGRRPLEDNWRRASKALGGATENSETKVAESDASEMKVNKEEYDKLLREIPLNPMRLQETKDKIMSSMFLVGKLFRDKIDNFAKSAQTLENMHTKFGFTPYELDSYFYLYLDYVDLGDMTKADEYKNKIIKKYPDSKYSGILTDPNFFNKTNSDENKAEKYYQTLYAQFDKGQYKEALNAIDLASTTIGDNHDYVSKMALLRAMCVGSTEGKDAYVKALTSFISLYPYAPEQLKAKEILRFLGGDNTAFASVQDVDKIYQREENTIHYATVVTYALDESKQINFKVSISEFNKQNYKNERLQLGDALLDVSNNSQVILIRKFENEADAMNYYKKVVSSKAEFTTNVDYTHDFFIISQTNYRKMISERSAAAYRVFFDNNILNQYMK